MKKYFDEGEQKIYTLQLLLDINVALDVTKHGYTLFKYLKDNTTFLGRIRFGPVSLLGWWKTKSAGFRPMTINGDTLK